jgi:hypothetical protein
LATPENRRKTPPPTRGTKLIRSTAWATLRNGGHVQKRGKTVQSLARRIGIDTKPVVTCTPCVMR